MPITDQLMKAMDMFTEATKEYGITSGINDATEAVNKLRQDTAMDPMKQLEAQNEIAKKLQSRLTSLNASQGQIASAVGAVAPDIPKTPEEIRQRALAATSKEEQMFWSMKADIAEQTMGQGRLAEKLPEMQQVQDFELEKIRERERLAARAAQVKATTSLTKEENQRLFEVSRQYEEKATPLRLAYRQADVAYDLLSSGNPVGESAAINGLVKASGDTGVITAADRDAFGGSAALTAKVKRAVSKASSGNLDQESRDLLLKVADGYRKKQRRELEDYADRFSKRVVNSLGIDQNRALSIVDPELYEQRQRRAKDQEALAWANANPKDPRAAAIKKRLGVM